MIQGFSIDLSICFYFYFHSSYFSFSYLFFFTFLFVFISPIYLEKHNSFIFTHPIPQSPTVTSKKFAQLFSQSTPFWQQKFENKLKKHFLLPMVLPKHCFEELVPLDFLLSNRFSSLSLSFFSRYFFNFFFLIYSTNPFFSIPLFPSPPPFHFLERTRILLLDKFNVSRNQKNFWWSNSPLCFLLSLSSFFFSPPIFEDFLWCFRLSRFFSLPPQNALSIQTYKNTKIQKKNHKNTKTQNKNKNCFTINSLWPY